MYRKKPDPSRMEEDNPEWTAEDFARARPAVELFPELVAYCIARKAREAEALAAKRGARAKPRKVAISLRVEADTLAAYKAGARATRRAWLPCWTSLRGNPVAC